jgi:hypothetical protein
MAKQDHDARPNDCAQPAQPSGNSSELDRVQELTWALLDEQIGDNDKAWLESALASSAEARTTYLRCVQIHADLSAHFAALGQPASAKPDTKSPVLGFLHGGMLPLELQSPPIEDAMS